jgi:hypothetical protein
MSLQSSENVKEYILSITTPICYLHIGMPKTGTSSIQDSLGEVSSLGDWGTYCKVDMSNNQTGTFSTMFLSNPENFYVNVKLGLSTEDVIPVVNENSVKLHYPHPQ